MPNAHLVHIHTTRAVLRHAIPALQASSLKVLTSIPSMPHSRLHILLQASGATKCTPARAGYHVPKPGANCDTPCENNSYSARTGASSCEPCPHGHDCPKGMPPRPHNSSPHHPHPSSSHKQGRRALKCLQPGQKACPLYTAAFPRAPSVLMGYECVDVASDLECVEPFIQLFGALREIY